MRVTLNDIVRVKLTDYGRKVMRENHEDLKASAYHAPEEDADGYSKWQLWCLIEEFGAHMRWGGELPFELEIDVKPRGEVIESDSLATPYVWEADKGVSITEAIQGALGEAKKRKSRVLLKFNDWQRLVSQFDDLSTLLHEWQQFQNKKDRRRG